MASSISRRAARGLYRGVFLGCGLLLAATSVGAVHAADYAERVATKISQVYMKNNRARAVLTVFNGNPDVLDIEVTCNFFTVDQKPAGRGRNTVSRLPGRRTDTLEVTDEMAVDVDSASCSVTNAVK